MGRPIFNYELGDPDFSWLISTFKENHPEYSFIESTGLPILFIANGKSVTEIREDQAQSEFEVPAPPAEGEETVVSGQTKRS